MKQFSPILAILVLASSALAQQAVRPFIDIHEMRDASTLNVRVSNAWHIVDGPVKTRQKQISIHVGDIIPGESYRVPVQLIVPVDRKAKGFFLTGDHRTSGLEKDARLSRLEVELLRGGIGVVHTVIQDIGESGQHQLNGKVNRKFIETLNPRYSIQFWGWPAALMRTVTAAYAEKEHFEFGKVALAGASKNGASPSAAIIHDDRMTGVYAIVSPIWDSPLRMCDEKVWKQTRDSNRRFDNRDGPQLRTGQSKRRDQNRFFLGGMFGPNFNNRALDRGHSWEDLKQLSQAMANQVFVSRNWEKLSKRKADLFFQPGTHDFVCYDVAWGGKHHPHIPTYLKVNSGHGVQDRHPGRSPEQNLSAWVLQHFFEDVESLLPVPEVTTSMAIDGEEETLVVVSRFPSGAKVSAGRVFWMFDREPDGSLGYVSDLFPHENWKRLDCVGNTWTASIPMKKDVGRIDFFCNFSKTISYNGKQYQTWTSSPYTRLERERTRR